MERSPAIAVLQRENDRLRVALARSAEYARRVAHLRVITARLASSLDRDEIFSEIVSVADTLYDGSIGTALLLTDETAETLRVETTHRLDHALGTVLPAKATAAARAIKTHRALALDDTEREPDMVFPTMDVSTRPGAMIVAPIQLEGQPFGVVEVYYARARHIPSEDVELLDALSNAAALALRNATAYARILDQGSELTRRNDELARQKQELIRLNVDLQRANILKSQFLSTMSHELRTPLTSIIGFSSVLLRERRGEVLSDRQRDNAARILSSARHLVTLINDILDLSRIEAGRLDVFRRDIDLRALLEWVRADLEQQALDKGLMLLVEVDAGLGEIVTDGDRLRQVLLNLVGNAVKFTTTGSVTLRATRGVDAVSIAVEDTGIGIASDEQEHVFDEFYQADQSNTRTAGGTGLGLTISRCLVELLGGVLSLRSVPGQGSAFTITLPLAARRHLIESRHAVPPRRARGDSTTILVIDDDPEMVVLLERVLEGAGYRIVGARSADEGQAKARELQPDAILLDVMMPEVDGWRTLHRLKSDSRTAHIPVVMHTIVADQALGFSLGATDYLVKPVERDQLLAVLNRATPGADGPVLIVDDDEGIRALLARILADEDIPVLAVADGEDALRRVAEQVPRLVLLDLMMPGLDGFAVLHQLRAIPATRQVPVIVITAKTLAPEEERVLKSEASLVIAKTGLPLDRLLDEVRSAIGAAR